MFDDQSLDVSVVSLRCRLRLNIQVYFTMVNAGKVFMDTHESSKLE